MDLTSLLIMPIQRLTKYRLLFKDLIKHTDETHPDYKDLQKALEVIGNINDENEKNLLE